MGIIPAAVDLPLRRNQPYVEVFEFTDDAGEPFGFIGYTAALQVRLYGGAPGAALITLGTVADDSQGLRLLYPGAWRVHIAEAALDGLPAAGEPGDTAAFVFDWRFDDGLPLGGAVWAEGTATLKPGVTKL